MKFEASKAAALNKLNNFVEKNLYNYNLILGFSTEIRSVKVDTAR